MAANKAQGRSFGVFLVGAVVFCGGIASRSTGAGKVLLVAGVLIVLAALGGFLKVKPQEGKSPLAPSSDSMKWIGGLCALAGWVVSVAGLHLVASTGGRIALALIGIGVSLFGILYVLPTTFNKTAFWKAPGAGKSLARAMPTDGKAELESGLVGASHAMESLR